MHCILFSAIFATEKFQKKFSTRSPKLNYWCPKASNSCFKGLDFLSNALSFSHVVKNTQQVHSVLIENKESFTGRLNSKISVTGTSCWSCQQLRLIFSLRNHRISIRLHMQDHNIQLSLFIISFYILTVLVLWNIFSKGPRHGHVMSFSAVRPKHPPPKSLKGGKSTNASFTKSRFFCLFPIFKIGML